MGKKLSSSATAEESGHHFENFCRNLFLQIWRNRLRKARLSSDMCFDQSAFEIKLVLSMAKSS